ncbi:MAG: class I SAM-dependent methyltransferase [Actinobacteria bacterium]|nr:class I SAM-dependent methyltransferase [Actinomycetota bacterium]
MIEGIARRNGLELVPVGSGRPDPNTEVIPRGSVSRFQTAEYEIVPKGAYDIVRHDYYSPIPDLTLLPDDIWDRRNRLAGVALNVDDAIALIESELADYVAEFDFPAAGPRPPGEFFLDNTNYGAVDAELLYAMVRARKPRRVLELGSGMTTLLIGEAARRNAADGVATEHLAYDPYPRAQILGEDPPPPTRFAPKGATEVGLDDFSLLGNGDILFVDTTHTVKLGSDVNYVVLDVLPTLASGVIVHFHDIFLPWEYPREWFESMGYFWAEQYLIQAFLAFNGDFEVLIPANAVAVEHPDRLARAIPSFVPGRRPGALWLRRR